MCNNRISMTTPSPDMTEILLKKGCKIASHASIHLGKKRSFVQSSELQTLKKSFLLSYISLLRIQRLKGKIEAAYYQPINTFHCLSFKCLLALWLVPMITVW